MMCHKLEQEQNQESDDLQQKRLNLRYDQHQACTALLVLPQALMRHVKRWGLCSVSTPMLKSDWT